MKKFTAILIIALIAMTSVFATLPDANIETTAASKVTSTLADAQQEQSILKVGVTVDVADMYSFAFGFTNTKDTANLEDAYVNTHPADASDLSLTYRSATAIADNADADLYFYYKVQYNAPINLEMSLPSDMKANKEGVADLPWTVKSVTTDKATSEKQVINEFTLDSNAGTDEGKKTTIAIANGDAANAKAWGICKLEVKTDPIPALKEKTSFSGNILFKIATV